jgi:hypothetical protein
MKFLFLALIASACLGRAQAFDLKGVEVGQVTTRAQLEAAFGARCAFEDPCLTEIEGVHVTVRVYRDKAGRVSSLSARFDSNDFATIEKAARAKFGTPSASDQQEMQNGFGARFTARGIWWTGADGARVTLLKSFSDSTLSILSPATAAAEEARKSKSKM